MRIKQGPLETLSARPQSCSARSRWAHDLWREMIQPSGQTDPFDVDRTVELGEEDQGVSVHRQRDE